MIRHRRLMDAPKLAFGLLKAAGAALIGFVARTAVEQHLVPGVGRYRIDKLAPEHLEKL